VAVLPIDVPLATFAEIDGWAAAARPDVISCRSGRGAARKTAAACVTAPPDGHPSPAAFRKGTAVPCASIMRREKKNEMEIDGGG